MRREAGMPTVGPTSGGEEVAEGSPRSRVGDSRSRRSGFIAGSPDDVCAVAGSPAARDGTPPRYRILAVGSTDATSDQSASVSSDRRAPEERKATRWAARVQKSAIHT